MHHTKNQKSKLTHNMKKPAETHYNATLVKMSTLNF